MTAPVSVKLLDPRAKLPAYGSADAAGADLYALTDGPVTVAPGQTVLIPTGLSLAIPQGYVGLVYARSGLATKQGLAPANKVGVIDADYRGELMVSLHNHSGEARVVVEGDRVAQLVIVPYLTARFLPTDQLDGTARGAAHRQYGKKPPRCLRAGAVSLPVTPGAYPHPAHSSSRAPRPSPRRRSSRAPRRPAPAPLPPPPPRRR